MKTPVKQTVTDFDPRTPHDRGLNHFALNRLYEKLKEHAANSAFFLYNISPSKCAADFTDDTDNVGEIIDISGGIYSEEELDTPESSLAGVKYVSVNTEKSDQTDIDEDFIHKFVMPEIESDQI